MTTQITVTIGRNIDNEPMPPRRWTGFQIEVADALSVATTLAIPIMSIQMFTGSGEWQGHIEESAMISVVTAKEPNLDWLRDRLAHLRATYGQDAIALAVGKSELIERG